MNTLHVSTFAAISKKSKLTDYEFGGPNNATILEIKIVE